MLSHCLVIVRRSSICIVVDTGIHYSKYGRAWQLPDNIWQQNQNCRLLFSKGMISPKGISCLRISMSAYRNTHIQCTMPVQMYIVISPNKGISCLRISMSAYRNTHKQNTMSVQMYIVNTTSKSNPVFVICQFQ